MKEFKLENDVIIRYHDFSGDEIPIIFIHGLGCASSFDYPQVVSMGSLVNHRRILVDLVGSGYSDKPEWFDYTIANHAKYLEELLSYLSLDNIVIFGHSMGGAVSIALAERVKDKVKAIILSEANLDAGGGFFSKQIASYSESDFIKFGYAKTLRESVVSGNTEWAAGLSNSSPIAIHRNAVSLIKGQTPSWRQIYYSLDTVKTYIYGSESLPDPDYDELARHKINVAVVANAGHSMAWENPEGLALVVEKYIK
ncbi:alpha/beta hydrolase [Photobacterium sp. CCB-ST2H9]|uniref:alpha/beta fold hydrolase n=1 Tax=Photobacterium sp. CCB-ST2H9 TaxID=2912855 RepID=UPI002006A621|nr:alpha/beta hydrolase [Photobacterium sp. CCB-ST2H9]UTM59103.1 alpha/beta hydrolase [Photobacterium sp. CCB-ST2H9]